MDVNLRCLPEVEFKSARDNNWGDTICFEPLKAFFPERWEKLGRRCRERTISRKGEVNNWSNVSEKSPSLTTKPNAKIKATHPNYKILADQTQNWKLLPVSASSLSGPYTSCRPLCGSDLGLQYIQTSLSYWWPARKQWGVLVLSSNLLFQNDFFIIHEIEKLIWSAVAVKPERLLFTVTMAGDIMICYPRNTFCMSPGQEKSIFCLPNTNKGSSRFHVIWK